MSPQVKILFALRVFWQQNEAPSLKDFQSKDSPVTPQLSMLHLLLVLEGLLTLFLILIFSTIVRSYQSQNPFFPWWVQAWLAFAVFLRPTALPFQFPYPSPLPLLLPTLSTL